MEERVEDGLDTSTPLPSRSTPEDPCEALADPVRRAVLGVLAERDRAELLPLAEAVVTRAPDGCSETDLHIDLHHNHLPKLDAAGAIEYDDGQKEAAVTTQGALLAANLDH